MGDFSSRSLRSAGTLGQRLQRMREERRYNIEVAAQNLQIQTKYLIAIEEGRYLDLPGDVYVRNFVRLYAEYLGANVSTALHLYDQERKVYASQEDRRARASLDKEQRIPKVIITPRRVRQGLVIIVILAILLYLGFEARRIIAPPDLSLSSPVADLRTSESVIVVAGQTEPEALVFINGEEVIPDSTGAFLEEVQLTDGINTITITARKSRGAEQTLVRNILVEKPAE